MTYDEAAEYLKLSYTIGSKKGHCNLKKLLKTFGNPDDSLKIIHVAGTNGKGSTCAMIGAILKEAGFKTGVFTSPHLHRYNERFAINGEYISDDEFALHVSRIKEHTERIFKEGEYFSFFEILTVLAFNYFKEKKVDFAIIETGLGGRLDATNVIKKPLISVITSIGFDHQEYLGTSISEITDEKKEIIKKDCTTVLYFQSKEVYNKIENICKKRNSKLYYFDNGLNPVVIHEDLSGTTFKITTEYFSYPVIKIKMIGGYQVTNSCNVLLVAEALKDLGINLTNENIINGLLNAFIPGRMEILRLNPTILLDGAHNLDGAVCLNHFLKKYRKNAVGRIIILMGVLKDKMWDKMSEKIFEFADEIVLTMPSNKRALDCRELLKYTEDKPAAVCPDCKEACLAAIKTAKADDLICCTGSLYLIGDIRAFYMSQL